MRQFLRSLVIEVRKTIPVTAATAVYTINTRLGHPGLVPTTPIKLADGSLIFDARKDKYGRERTMPAHMFDPTPDAPWPHQVCYTVGYYQTTQVAVRTVRPDPAEYVLLAVPTQAVCLALDREDSVFEFLSARAPHTLRVDYYALSQKTGLSSSTLKKWVETGVASRSTKEAIQTALGITPEDLIP